MGREEEWTYLLLGKSSRSKHFPPLSVNCIFWQSLTPWAYRQGSFLLDSQAFQRLAATRIKAQESVVQAVNLISYFLLWIFSNSCKSEWNSKMKPMYIYSNFNNMSNCFIYCFPPDYFHANLRHYFIYTYINKSLKDKYSLNKNITTIWLWQLKVNNNSFMWLNFQIIKFLPHRIFLSRF